MSILCFLTVKSVITGTVAWLTDYEVELWHLITSIKNVKGLNATSVMCQCRRSSVNRYDQREVRVCNLTHTDRSVYHSATQLTRNVSFDSHGLTVISSGLLVARQAGEGGGGWGWGLRPEWPQRPGCQKSRLSVD